MAQTSLREAYFDLLMKQIESFRYPSPSMMDRLEEMVGSRQAAEEYVGILIDLVGQDAYPSLPMLDRLSRLVDALEPRGNRQAS